MRKRSSANQLVRDVKTGKEMHLDIRQAKKNRSHFSNFVQLNFAGALFMAQKENSSKTHAAVFSYILGTMQPQNVWVYFPQKASAWTNIKGAHIGQAIRALEQKGVIRQIGKLGSNRVFRVNPYLAWYGHADDFSKYVIGFINPLWSQPVEPAVPVKFESP